LIEEVEMKPSNVVALILVGTLSSAGAETIQIPKNVKFQVTCLDCSLRNSLTPTGINSAGVIVANSKYRGYIIDHGKITAVPGIGGPSSTANGINDAGLVVGTSGGVWNGNPGAFAFTWDGTTLTDLGDPINIYPRGGYFSRGAVVNASGQVAGQAMADFQLDVAFIYSAGVMTPIEFPGSQSTFATGINSHGRVVGTAPPGELWHAWTYKDGTITDLNGSAERGDAFGINDHDQIVGDLHTDDKNGQPFPHAVLWDRSTTPTFLPAPPGLDFPYAYAINNHGWVVGQACVPTTVTDCVAALSDGTRTIDLNQHLDPADETVWFLVKPVGINDAGQIIGTGTFYGHPQAFLATPIQ
jgi:probable HAF family extracellular repeat protein